MSSDTSQIILETARRLFISQGYTATSIRQIAVEAGIGKATIYHHFPDKESIALALLQQSTARSHSVVETIQAERDPRQRIQIATEASLSFINESADILQVVRREVRGGRQQLQAEFRSFLHNQMALVTDALRQGIQQGIFRPIDPAGAARVLMIMIQGSFVLTHLGGETPHPPQQAASALLDVFFQGIDPR